MEEWGHQNRRALLFVSLASARVPRVHYLYLPLVCFGILFLPLSASIIEYVSLRKCHTRHACASRGNHSFPSILLKKAVFSRQDMSFPKYYFSLLG